MLATFGAGLSVLVVDDDPAVRSLLQLLLEGEDFEVHCAATIAQAHEQWRARRSDLLLLDKNLPDGDGLQLMRQLRREVPDCEAILMTAEHSVEAAVQSLEVGASDFLQKPFEHLDVVRQRVKRVCEHLRLQRSNRELFAKLGQQNLALQSMTEELKVQNRRLANRASLDQLTGLLNHAAFQERLKQEIDRARQHERPLSLILLDIDHYQHINQYYGHHVADLLLRSIALLLQRQPANTRAQVLVREFDIAARYGGDEFALILPETVKGDALVIAEGLRAQVERLQEDGDIPLIGVSAGVSSYPEDASSRQPLVRAAEAALTMAKQQGRNRAVAYSASFDDPALRQQLEDTRMRRFKALQTVIEDGLVKFLYQPIVSIDGLTVFSYEALVRPTEATFRGPLDLIKAAEEANRLAELGVVLRRIAASNMAAMPEGRLLFLNLHPDELFDPRLLQIPPELRPWLDRLVFEITEARGISDYQAVNNVIGQLRGQGIRVALDDIGAGYSGLNSLALLEADFIKLDMDMLRDIHANPRRQRLVRHLLEYARDEGIQVIAEGIENLEEYRVVRALGIKYVQGYYFSKPQPPFVEVDPARFSDALN